MHGCVATTEQPINVRKKHACMRSVLTLRYRSIENQQLGFTHIGLAAGVAAPFPVQCEEGGEREKKRSWRGKKIEVVIACTSIIRPS
jgi:hypothetical protein